MCWLEARHFSCLTSKFDFLLQHRCWVFLLQDLIFWARTPATFPWGGALRSGIILKLSKHMLRDTSKKQIKQKKTNKCFATHQVPRLVHRRLCELNKSQATIAQTSTQAVVVLVLTSSNNSRSGFRSELTALRLDRPSQHFSVVLD